MATEPDLLAQRYGRRPAADPARTRRRLQILAAAAIVIGVVFIGWAAMGRQRSSVEWLDLGVDAATITEDQITTTFQVITPRGVGAVCTIRAMNSGLLEVGRQDVVIPAENSGRTTRTLTLRTTERANNAGVKSCVRA